MFPICCQNCSKAIGHLLKTFEILSNKKEKSITEIFEELNIKRYCCRMLFITYYDEYINIIMCKLNTILFRKGYV